VLALHGAQGELAASPAVPLLARAVGRRQALAVHAPLPRRARARRPRRRPRRRRHRTHARACAGVIPAPRLRAVPPAPSNVARARAAALLLRRRAHHALPDAARVRALPAHPAPAAHPTPAASAPAASCSLSSRDTVILRSPGATEEERADAHGPHK